MSTGFGGGGDRSTEVITPHRKTAITFDPPQVVRVRPPWSLEKTADRIGRLPAAGGPSVLAAGSGQPSLASTDMLQVPGPAWIMRPLLMDPQRLGTTDDTQPIPDTDWNLAEGWVTKQWWRLPSLPGVSGGGGLRDVGAASLVKTVDASSGSYAAELTADAAAFPKAITNTDTLTMRRIGAGLVTYPANAAFRVMFLAPSGLLSGPSGLVTFYFGGRCDVLDPAKGYAGEFALHFQSTGTAILFEKSNASTWKERLRFRYASGAYLAGGLVGLDILPVGRDSLAFFSFSSDFAAPALFTAAPELAPLPGSPHWTHYRDTATVTGIKERRSITAPGVVRLDLREDLRVPVWVWAHKFPADSYLTDEPFVVDVAPLETGSLLDYTAETWNWKNASVTTKLYNADTHAEVVLDAEEQKFPSVADQVRYYPRYKLQSSSDRYNTPVLYSAKWFTPGKTRDNETEEITGGTLTRLSITGPDLDPSHESAHATIEDLKAELGAALDNRGNTPAKITTQYDANEPSLVSTLFEGRVSQAPAKRMGRERNEGFAGLGPPVLYPSKDWKTYQTIFVGQWALVAEQQLLTSRSYGVDETDDPPNGTSKRRPWKVTAILADLLEQAGFAPEQIDIEDIDLRLFPIRNPQDAMAPAGTEIGPFLQHLCRGYLGRTLVWCGNSKKTEAKYLGLWRLLPEPKATDEALINFVKAAPGKLGMHPNSYAEYAAPIVDGSFEEYFKPPEFSVLTVTATGELLPNNAGPEQLSFTIKNPVCFGGSLDKTSPDYVPNPVHVILFDSLLQTKEALQFVAQRIYDVAAHGEKWCTFRAPLKLIYEPGYSNQVRPRPLRINDVVTVMGQKAIVRNCNPDAEHDSQQMALYECRYFPS